MRADSHLLTLIASAQDFIGVEVEYDARCWSNPVAPLLSLVLVMLERKASRSDILSLNSFGGVSGGGSRHICRCVPVRCLVC